MTAATTVSSGNNIKLFGSMCADEVVFVSVEVGSSTALFMVCHDLTFDIFDQNDSHIYIFGRSTQNSRFHIIKD